MRYFISTIHFIAIFAPSISLSTSIYIDCTKLSEAQCFSTGNCMLVGGENRSGKYQCVNPSNICESGFNQRKDGKKECERNKGCRFVPGECYCPPMTLCICGGGTPPACIAIPEENWDDHAENQDRLLTILISTNDKAVWQRNAELLAGLWERGKLAPANKTILVEKYFKLVLKQNRNRYKDPLFEVRDQQSFPFPKVWIQYTPTLYKNGKVFMEFDRPQTSRAMKDKDHVITSIAGGEIYNGDIVHYKIKMEDKHSGNDWSHIMQTNKVRVEGLKK